MQNRLYLFFVCYLLWSCGSNNSEITGLWLISSVKVGTESMTPNARWVRFSADGKQQSGNGWLQHSTGTFEYTTANGKLSFQVEEGLEDEFGEFTVSFPATDRMEWTRVEGGQTVTVDLQRAKQLPPGYTDEARGLWKLVEAKGESNLLAAEQDAHLFFRWDGRFFDYRSVGPGSAVGSQAGGVYNVHGHKPEIELIPYDADLARSWWQFSVEGNTLTIQLLNSEMAVTRTYEKQTAFPAD